MRISRQKKMKNHRMKTQQLYNHERHYLDSQVTINRKVLNQLRVEYEGLKKKLTLSDSASLKIEYDTEIESLKIKLKEMKLNINQNKRKTIMSEKKIQTDEGAKVNINKQFYDLQQEYITYFKKKQKLEKKINKIEEENAVIIYEEDDVIDSYKSVKDKFKEIQPSQEVQNNEHRKVLYETKKRKLELMLKKREREDEFIKRKYYDQLINCDKTSNKTSEHEYQIKKVERQIQNSEEQLSSLKQILQGIRSSSKLIKNEQSQYSAYKQRKIKTQAQENYEGFLLTQFQQYKQPKEKENNNEDQNDDEMIEYNDEVSERDNNQTPINKIAKTSSSLEQVLQEKKKTFKPNEIQKEKYLIEKGKFKKLSLKGSVKSQTVNSIVINQDEEL